jgi:hypothetical protein
MRTLAQLIEHGTPWLLHGTGSYFRLLESVEPVNVRVRLQGRIVYEALGVEAGFYTMPAGGFDAVEVATTRNPQQVKVAISEGGGGYDRYTGTVNLATGTSVVNTGMVPVGVTCSPVVPANARRKGVRFLNSGETVIYLGGLGVDLVNGCLKLNPGELLLEQEAPGAAWFAVSEGGQGSVKVQELMT